MHSISLFTGAMGLDLGLEAVGIKPVLCVEKNRSCLSTIALNRPNVKLWESVTTLGNVLKDHDGCFLVAGGPPCQAFSTAGRRRAFDDPRGVLLLEFGKVVATIRPRFFVFENVRGLLSAKLQDGSSVFEYVIKGYEDIGYKVVHGLLDAVDFGVPQFRERLFVIGSRDGEDIFMPTPTHFSRHQDPLYRWQTLRDAIGDIEHDPGPGTSFSPKKKKWLLKIPEGGNWKSLTSEDAKAAMGNAFDSSGGRTGYLRRLSYSEPCPTLLTSPTQKATILCHPTKDRPLSLKEYARIQQFPNDWIFYGTVAERYRQIGNAVPIGLGEAIGRVIGSVALGVDKVKTRRKG